jgi:hypothetical protein
MTDEPDRKILSIATRAPFVAPAPGPDADPDAPDLGSQAVVEAVKTLVEAGQIRGLVVLGWDAELGRFERWVALGDEKETSNAALHFIGGLELMKEALTDIAVVEGGYDEHLVDDFEEFLE